MMKDWWVNWVVLGLAVVVLVLVLIVGYAEDQRRDACVAKGGVVLKLDGGGTVCVQRSVVIEDEYYR